MTEQWSSDEPQPGRGWYDDDELYDDEERSGSYPPDSLVTFRFLFDAVRRHKKLWILTALLGVLGALAFPYVLPPASSSSTKVLLTHRDGDDPTEAMATDVSLARTHSVATRVIEKLNLSDTPDELLKRYTATAQTDRILEVVASAPTSAEATSLAGTIATTYLQFRREQVALLAVPMRRDLATAKQEVTEAEADVRAAGGNPRAAPPETTTPEWTRLTRAREQQVFIDQQILDQKVTAARMSSSRILDEAAPVPFSERRALVINIGAGLLAGLFIGIGFVVVRALISDKLWRRQDIARALGTRVKLSVGRAPRVRWRPLPRYVSRAKMRKPEVRLIVRQLRHDVSMSETPKPALVVVSVENVETSALAVASLAMSFAEEGKRVLTADLSGTGKLAAALGVTEAGTHESRANEDDDSVLVHLPARNAEPAEGRHLKPTGPGPDADLDAAWNEADLVLTLATVSPAIGADHLRTWASRAVAVVTAGQSTVTSVTATGELVRLAGVRLVSAIVVQADRTDESVGVAENDAAAETVPEASSGVEMISR